MDYQLAIMSYDRAEQLASLTVPTLEQMKTDFSKVTVFVANEEQRQLYEQKLPNLNYVITEIGHFNSIHSALTKHYEPGTPVVVMDDDIERMEEKQDNKLVPYKGTLDDLANLGFSICERSGAKMWGIYPVHNHFFMKYEAVIGLRYLAGGLWGTYAGDAAITNDKRTHESSGNDFETTLESYRIHGKVARIEWITYYTKYFTTGGIDTELKQRGFDNRQTHHAKSLQRLAKRYPSVTKIKVKAGGVVNLSLKTITLARYDKDDFS